MNGVYQYWQIKFAEHSNDRQAIPLGEVIDLLSFYRMPNEMKVKIILKEMEELGMIKINNDEVQIVNCKYDKQKYANMNPITKRKRMVELIC